MFTHQTAKLARNISSKCYHTILKLGENERKSVATIFANFKNCKNITIGKRYSSSDVVVIGGGAMGSSCAYWLREISGRNKDLRVVVVEKDPTYAKCSTSLSVGGIRQQFSLPENIQMSLFGAEFLRGLKDKFGSDADVAYNPNGYLVLSSEKGAEQLMSNFNLQQELGANNRLLTKNQLKEIFPWLNVSDVELGCLGGEKEGWFDPWRLLSLLKSVAINRGARFIQGEITSFVFGENQSPKGVEVTLSNGKKETITFNKCVIAAGPESGKVAKLANIGTGSGILSVPLPVERRKRYVYRFDCQGQNPPQTNSPLMIDFTGAYFRKDGASYIGGQSPSPDEEPDTADLEVDFDFFDNRVWPLLAHRIPAFENIKVKSAWGGFYEYNCFDANAIIGSHPHYQNLYFATGFSGHGIQQSPAAGLAVAELIVDGRFKTIDLTRLGFDRLITHKPVYEHGIY